MIQTVLQSLFTVQVKRLGCIPNNNNNNKEIQYMLGRGFAKHTARAYSICPSKIQF